MKATRLLTGLVMSGVLWTLQACAPYPTERQSVVDLRPQVSFRFNASDERFAQARVQVDGIDAGNLADFVDGRGALRVISGSHTVRVVSGSTVLFEERAYLGDGVSRPFIVK
ncbi:MAG: hypothetical protein RLZZ618_1953 [Pseudomonadota bacterium]|jgi:hypothetical protein